MKGGETMRQFLKELRASLRRIRKADPVTFWLSMYSFVIGNVALFLQLLRLFQLWRPR